MATLNKQFNEEMASCISEYLEASFKANEPMAIVGRTVSIGYKFGQYHVTKADLKDKTLITLSFREAELDDAVAYFLKLYENDPIGHLDFEDTFYVGATEDS